VRPLGTRKGDRLCHVYSDTSHEELIPWGRRHGLRHERVDRKHILPHYDVRADLVSEHEPGASLLCQLGRVLWFSGTSRTPSGP
ncbi:MAG: DUF4031 domain-containing protein, partial [Gemmatimonadota bacterium]